MVAKIKYSIILICLLFALTVTGQAIAQEMPKTISDIEHEYSILKEQLNTIAAERAYNEERLKTLSYMERDIKIRIVKLKAAWDKLKQAEEAKKNEKTTDPKELGDPPIRENVAPGQPGQDVEPSKTD